MKIFSFFVFFVLLTSLSGLSYGKVRFVGTEEAAKNGTLQKGPTYTEGDPYANKKVPDSAFKGHKSTQGISYKTKDCQGSTQCEKALKRQMEGKVDTKSQAPETNETIAPQKRWKVNTQE